MPSRTASPQRLFGAAVRAERLRQKLSQEELAHRSGISTAFMSHVERGTKAISIETIMKVASGLRVKAGELFVKADL
jgi:Predicted transcriptional regulators